MIAADVFKDRRVALFGLGGSGRATLESLKDGGADVFVSDDRLEGVEAVSHLADGTFAEGDALAGFDALVLSPGVPLTHPAPHWSARAAQAAGVPVIGDLEIFARQLHAAARKARLICITGTNGKSTTTALTAHVLRRAGLDVRMGGNIGTPALALAPPSDGAVYVIECSSYQIDLAPGLTADIGIHLNLTPDHIDRHGTFENYAAVKGRLIERAKRAVVGVDDAASAAIASKTGAVRISVEGAAAEIGFEQGCVIDRRTGETFDLSAAPALQGAHNAQNAAAAIAAAQALGVEADAIRAALCSFPGLAHRMQPIRTIGRTLFVNDSKATNAAATENALKTYPRIRWILGGIAKDEGIDPLTGYFDRIEKAYLIGEASERFRETLQGVAASSCGTLEAAVAEAAADAAACCDDAVVLLSPACASWDQFTSFAARGDAFAALVGALDASGDAA